MGQIKNLPECGRLLVVRILVIETILGLQKVQVCLIVYKVEWQSILVPKKKPLALENYSTTWRQLISLVS